MNSTKVSGRLFHLLAVCLMAVASTASAQPVFSYPADPGVVIISYSETPLMLGNPDLTPRIQVFGDGRVQVHYPVYMKKAGDYELYLSPEEIQQLLQVLSGVFSFDPVAVSQASQAIAQSEVLKGGILTYRSESTLEHIQVQLDVYQAGPGAVAQSVNLDLSWKDIAADAQAFSEIIALQQLAGARQGIRALLSRNDLLKVNAAGTQGAANE